MPQERGYILEVVLGDILGFEWAHLSSERKDTRITCVGETRGSITIPDVFFSISDKHWLNEKSLPSSPLSLWNTSELNLNISLESSTVPVIYGDKAPRSYCVSDNIYLPIDIFGSAFFMLSRYEELIVTDRDCHNRFPAGASLAFQNGFLARPIVDEYLEVLWACVSYLWPGIKRKKQYAKKVVSCDLDQPYDCTAATFRGMIKRVAHDLIDDKSSEKALRTILASYQWWRKNFKNDPYLNAVDWIMDVNERAGNSVAFYFITKNSHRRFDGCYSMDEPVIRNLIRSIINRGHEIGLHASYDSYRDAAQITNEANELLRVFREENINHDRFGSRQHYLRWETPVTARYLDAANILYDSSLAYASHPGFRCGTCRTFKMYDLDTRQPLQLYQKPLVLMECSVLGEQYMGQEYNDDTLQLMLNYKDVCQRFSGEFTLLWHNSHFGTENDKAYYLELIK